MRCWQGFQEADQGTNRRGIIDAPFKSLPAQDLEERLLAGSARPHTSGLPSQGLNDMPLDRTLSGRMERRLPIIIMVRLAQTERAGTDEEEKTYTDNVSTHGARVFSRRSWQPGDQVMVTPVNQESATCGNVVYCQRLADDRYGIGVTFQGPPVTWSALHKYDGT